MRDATKLCSCGGVTIFKGLTFRTMILGSTSGISSGRKAPYLHCFKFFFLLLSFSLSISHLST